MRDILDTARAEALYVSTFATGTVLTAEEATIAIRVAVRTLHIAGCAARMAEDFGGDCPDLAARRMRWARAQVKHLFPARPAAHITSGVAHSLPALTG